MASPTSELFRLQPLVRREDINEDHCKEHGPFINVQVEQFDGSYLGRGCPRCTFAALNTAPVDSDAHLQAKARKQADRLNSLLVQSGITPRFRDCTFDTFRTGAESKKVRALETCRAYSDQFEENYQGGRSLILAGNVGTGKTHLASAMVQAIIRKHAAIALIVSVAEIVRVFRGTMTKGATYTDTDALMELALVDLLVIDEVGAQKGSDYELGLLHEVIDARYQRVVPTVLVSNLPADALKDFIGERAIDRLRENGGKAIGFTWPSARGRA